MKNILVVHRKRNGFEEAQSCWKDYTFHFVDFCLHYMFKVKESGEIQGILNREKMENAVRAIAGSGCDAVFSESAEAFLLQYVLMKKGVQTPPFVIADLNRLVKAQALCRWIESVYGENPFENIVSSPKNYWFCYTYSEIAEHETLGIALKRLSYVPTSLYFQDETMIAKKGRAKQASRNPPSAENPPARSGSAFGGKPVLEAVRGQIIACGNNFRDYETLVLAADGLPFDVHIISSDFYAKKQGGVPANVHVHDYVPQDTVYHVLSSAKFVVIPLKPTYLSPGTGMAGLVIGFGKPIIASDFPCLHDYVLNGENGILVKPGDSEALRRAILDLYEDEAEQRRMGENAKKLSDALDAVAEKNLEKLFSRAASSASYSREQVLRT